MSSSVLPRGSLRGDRGDLVIDVAILTLGVADSRRP